MAFERRVHRRLLVPGAALRAQPLEQPEVASLGRLGARVGVPPPAVRAQPPHRVELPAFRRVIANAVAPVAPVPGRPLQELEVTLPRGVFARALVPRAALRPQPLKELEVSRARRRRARPLVPLGAVAPRPPHHREVARLGTPPHRLVEDVARVRRAAFERPHQQIEVAVLRGRLAYARDPPRAARAQPLERRAISALGGVVAHALAKLEPLLSGPLQNPEVPVRRGSRADRVRVERVPRGTRVRASPA